MRVRHRALTVWVLAMMTTTSGWAQQSSVQLAQTGSVVHDFSIPSKPLAQSLDDFGKVTGLSVIYTSTKPTTLIAPAMSGRVSAEQALTRLLTGSGLTWRFTDARTVTLEQVAAEGAMTLDAVTVEGATQSGNRFDPGRSEGSGAYVTKSTNTATKLDLSAKETPQSVTVITRQRMDDAGLSSINEVMESTTGITVANYDSDRHVFLSRGFEVDNIKYDGVSAPYDGTYQYGMSQTDMALYDRVEVVRGATGLMSGAGNPSAVVNMIRKRPLKESMASATATVGSWNDVRGEADVSTPLTADGRVRARMVAVTEDKDSYLDRYHSERRVAYGIVEADLTPDTLLTVGADFQDNKPTASSWGGFPLFYSNGARTDFDVSENPAADWSSWEQYSQTSFVTLDHQFANKWKTKLAYTLLRNGYDATLGSAGGGSLNQNDGSGMELWVGKYEADKVTHSIEATLSGPFQALGREHEMVGGVTGSWGKAEGPQYSYSGYDASVGNYYTWDGKAGMPAFTRSGSIEGKTDQIAGYGAARLRPTDQLSLVAGTRLSSWKTSTTNYDTSGAITSSVGYSHHGIVTPYAGAVYDLTPTMSVYASYTDIFKPQDARDRSGAYLDPITGASYETGVKGEFLEKRLNASAALFRITQDNLAKTDPSGFVLPDGTTASVAVKGTTTKGFEVEFSGEAAEGWNIYGGFTRQISQDGDGTRTSTTEPQSMLRLFTTYRLPGDWNRLTIGGGVNWQSGMYADINNVRVTQEAYAVVNLMARYEITDSVTAAMNINNLFDERYLDNIGFYNTGYYGAPLNAKFSVKATF